MSATARRDGLASCRVLWITDRFRLRAPLADHAERLLAAGLPGLVLRERDLDDPPFEDMARRLAAAARAGGARLLLTNRVASVARAGADGVHLGRGGPALEAARGAVGPAALVGVSLHGERDLEAGSWEPADYLVVSPVFATESKPAAVPLGLERLAAFCRAAPLPVFALGGVGAANAAACRDAGAHGVAVVGALCGPSPEREWEALARAVAGSGVAGVTPTLLC